MENHIIKVPLNLVYYSIVLESSTNIAWMACHREIITDLLSCLCLNVHTNSNVKLAVLIQPNNQNASNMYKVVGGSLDTIISLLLSL